MKIRSSSSKMKAKMLVWLLSLNNTTVLTHSTHILRTSCVVFLHLRLMHVYAKPSSEMPRHFQSGKERSLEECQMHYEVFLILIGGRSFWNHFMMRLDTDIWRLQGRLSRRDTGGPVCMKRLEIMSWVLRNARDLHRYKSITATFRFPFSLS